MLLSIFSWFSFHSHILFCEVFFQVFCPFLKIRFFWILCYIISLYILDKSSLSNICFTNISSLFVGCIFISLAMPLVKQKFLILWEFHFSIFKFVASVFFCPKKNLYLSKYPKYSSYFSSRNFTVEAFAFRSMTSNWFLYLECGKGLGSSFVFMQIPNCSSTIC